MTPSAAYASGRAVKQLMARYKISPAELVVIYDDYDLPKGHVRIRPSGSAGTHNGMRSVIAETGLTEFARIRIGIRDPEVNIPIINYVPVSYTHLTLPTNSRV